MSENKHQDLADRAAVLIQDLREDEDGEYGPVADQWLEDYRTSRTGGLIDTGSQNITGYRPQPTENRDLVNAVKEMERNFAAWLEQVYFGADVGVDPRQVASARTHLEYAFYHLNRAVFQPADPIGDVIKAGPKRG